MSGNNQSVTFRIAMLFFLSHPATYGAVLKVHENKSHCIMSLAENREAICDFWRQHHIYGDTGFYNGFYLIPYPGNSEEPIWRTVRKIQLTYRLIPFRLTHEIFFLELNPPATTISVGLSGSYHLQFQTAYFYYMTPEAVVPPPGAEPLNNSDKSYIKVNLDCSWPFFSGIHYKPLHLVCPYYVHQYNKQHFVPEPPLRVPQQETSEEIPSLQVFNSEISQL